MREVEDGASGLGGAGVGALLQRALAAPDGPPAALPALPAAHPHAQQLERHVACICGWWTLEFTH